MPDRKKSEPVTISWEEDGNPHSRTYLPKDEILVFIELNCKFPGCSYKVIYTPKVVHGFGIMAPLRNIQKTVYLKCEGGHEQPYLFHIA